MAMENRVKDNSALQESFVQSEGPYRYDEKEVFFENKEAGISLAGTITIPQGSEKGPAVVLVAGYGKNDRDNSMMGHKPFSVIADYLARQGITVLRFDKRGVGSSSGVYETATTEDFAQDVQAAVMFLAHGLEFTRGPLGIIGFSEGGLIATMVAARCPEVGFTVLMGPALVTDTETLVKQMAAQLQADGASASLVEADSSLRKEVYTLVTREPDRERAHKELRALFQEYWASLPEELRAEAQKYMFAFTQEKIDFLVPVFNGPWYRFFLTYDARPVVRAVKVPTLILTGENDHIISAPKLLDFVSEAAEDTALKNYTFISMPHLNHAFQTCRTGAFQEYGTSTEAIATAALETISQWIKTRGNER